MGRLDGKVAVITGATSGIGLHTAELFVAEGAKVVIAGRRAPEGEALAKKLGATCIFRQTDVTVEAQMKALIALSVEKFGRIDCLFNNAGGPAQTGGIEGLEVERFDAAMATLIRSVMLGMKHAAPHMRKQGCGSIINNGSIAGTLFWIDPKEQLIAIYMVQVDDGVRIMLRNQFRTMVQSAIIN